MRPCTAQNVAAWPSPLSKEQRPLRIAESRRAPLVCCINLGAVAGGNCTKRSGRATVRRRSPSRPTQAPLPRPQPAPRETTPATPSAQTHASSAPTPPSQRHSALGGIRELHFHSLQASATPRGRPATTLARNRAGARASSRTGPTRRIRASLSAKSCSGWRAGGPRHSRCRHGAGSGPAPSL